MATSRQPRRTTEQWQAIVDSYLSSGLTAPQFCKRENLNYASFIKWKRRLAQKTVAGGSDISSFIELTPAPVVQPHWVIELDLAPGVQLRIAR